VLALPYFTLQPGREDVSVFGNLTPMEFTKEPTMDNMAA
jgi:hypothetical protein